MRKKYKTSKNGQIAKTIKIIAVVFLMCATVISAQRTDHEETYTAYSDMDEYTIRFYDTIGNDSNYIFDSDQYGTHVLLLNGTDQSATFYGNVTMMRNLTISEFNVAGFVKNDASGLLSGGNSIDISADTNLGGTAPIVIVGDDVTITQASAISDGYLSSVDWINFNTAFGWGDHGVAGYLTDWTNGDPFYNVSDAFGFTWAMAAGWNASGGLQNFEDWFNSTSLSTIVSAWMTNWNTSYGWGNHASQNYLDLDTYPNTDTDNTDDLNKTDSFSGDVTGTYDATVVGDDSHNHVITNIDSFTEAELETQLSDVADVYTNNDFTDNSGDWDTAFGWGDHSIVGYLADWSDGDPHFNLSDAFGFTWAMAAGWNASGGLQNFEDWFNSTSLSTIVSAWMTNWNTSYGWGDHGVAGYLTDWTNGDPFYNVSDAFGFTWAMAAGWNASGGLQNFEDWFNSTSLSTIVSAWMTNWNTSYGWGNHASQNYLDLDTYPNTDTDNTDDLNKTDSFSGDVTGTYDATVVGDDSHNHVITNIDSFTEAELETQLSDVADVYTNNDFTDNSGDWDTAFGWGDHSIVGYLADWSDGDPHFNLSDAFGFTWAMAAGWNASGGLQNFEDWFNSTSLSTIVSAWMTNWNTSYGWGDHGVAGYLTDWTNGDPFYNVSDAFGFTWAMANGWNASTGLWNRSGTTMFPFYDGDNVQINGTVNASNGNFSYLDIANDMNVSGTINNLTVFGSFNLGNTQIGYNVGNSVTTGAGNIFLGYEAGHELTTGNSNVFIGKDTGYYTEDGDYNVFIGFDTGYENVDGSSNMYLGIDAGYYGIDANRNTFVGAFAGMDNVVGNDSVFIGYEAGRNELNSNMLYIANSANPTSTLIKGNFASKDVWIDDNLTASKYITAHSFFGDAGNMTNTSTAGDYWNRSDDILHTYYNGDSININGSINTDNLGSIDNSTITVAANMTFSGNKTINATGVLTLGDSGDTTIGDSTERNMYPLVNKKINLGTATNMFNDLFLGGEFHPPRISQNAAPTPAVGELTIWHDADDNKVYLIYNDLIEGVVKIELV